MRSRSDALAWSCLAAIMAASAVFALLVVPPRLLVGGHPIATLDYALHFARAAASHDLRIRCGSAWGYDPHFMAGYPTGTVFDVNNKGIEFFVSALNQAGLTLPTAFNLFVFITVLLPPVLMWATARVFGLSPWQQVAVAGLTLALWLMDPEVSKTWRVGVIAFGMAMYCLPFSLSCLYRFCQSRSLSWFLGALLSGVALSLLHPSSFLFFTPPVLAWLLGRRVRDRSMWAAVAAFGAVVLATNWFWIVPVMQQLGLRTPSGRHWTGNLHALARDVLGISASGLRLLFLVLGSLGLWMWWRNTQKELARFLLAPIVMLTLIGYVAGEFPLLSEMELYRSNLIAALLLTIPAAGCLSVAIPAAWRQPIRIRLALAGLVLLVVLNLTGRNLIRIRPILRGGTQAYSVKLLGPSEMDVLQWLKAHAARDRRVVVERWPLGALTPWYTGLEVIGGPYQHIWLQHGFANYAALENAGEGIPDGERAFGRDVLDLSSDEIASYFDAYNVGTVVAFTPTSKETFGRAAGIERVEDIGIFTIYRNTNRSTSFLAGRGRVVAEKGRLTIRDASMGELILKYHWAPFLAAYPQQEIRPRRVLDDPVPFIELPSNRFESLVIAQAGCRPEL